ncbi:MAG: 3-phosphoshikimate 1-carboxyvinyltransferase [Actinomycetota bacterium]|nr:3-phosphoshikimate 1-carboxyvinyltransferase [Actinomycetota bacterium]
MKRLRTKTRPLRGDVTIPGDKSISHRALIIGALAAGGSRVRRPNFGADVHSTAEVLRRLGVRVELDEMKGQAKVEGVGGAAFREPEAVLDAGNSGTTMRLMAGACAGADGLFVLTGDDSLRRRPMLRVVAPLRQMGARIDGRNHGDLAPLTVRGGALTGVDVELPVASAQVKSALLLAGLNAAGVTRVSEPRRSRDHTERMLASAGIHVESEGRAASVRGGQRPHGLEGLVPGDISSAMFLIAAAALVPGSDLNLLDVGLNPTRRAALDVLRMMGAEVDAIESASSLGEPLGTVRARAASLRGIAVPEEWVPSLIDDIPALAIVATQAEGETSFTGAGELRVKESDRIAALVAGLRELGADAEELPDGLIVRGPTSLTGGHIDSVGDHRIALAFAVAGLIASDRVRIAGWSCVDTSFPEFLDVLGEATDRR